MRILILSQWFDPEPTFKGLPFARALRDLGHEVEVVTGYPNYPGGRLYPGYAIRGFTRETIEGVPVRRVPLYPSHDRSAVKRALNYLSFALSATFGVLIARRPDVVYVYHPPATAAVPAMILKAIKGSPFVLDVQDLWPDTLAATGMAGGAAIQTMVGALVRAGYRSANHVVVLSEGFRRKLLDRGVPEGKLSVIPNWTFETGAAAPVAPRDEAAFTVVYAGNLGKAQALDTVLHAAARLAASAPSARFVLVGDGVEADDLASRAAARGLSNVAFLPRRPASEVGGLLASADALLVHLRDDPLFSITIPSKIQAYLRAGRPILAGVRGDAAVMVSEAGAGLIFAPEDAEDLERAVREMMALPAETRLSMGESGARYYDQRLALSRGVTSFERVLERASLSGRPGFAWKRAFDLVVSAGLIAMLAAPMAVIALAVAVSTGRPVLFRQQRPGRFGRPFRILKFRTMTEARGAEGALRPDTDRLTPLGRWLRASSLDELPSLINVLKGDMSLVGPRPLLMRYTPFFTEEESIRLLVRPGVTGLAQTKGRNLVAWSDRLAFDACYVRYWSFRLDLKLLALTAKRVLRHEGVVVDPDTVMLDLDEERRAGAFR